MRRKFAWLKAIRCHLQARLCRRTPLLTTLLVSSYRPSAFPVLSSTQVAQFDLAISNSGRRASGLQRQAAPTPYPLARLPGPGTGTHEQQRANAKLHPANSIKRARQLGKLLGGASNPTGGMSMHGRTHYLLVIITTRPLTRQGGTVLHGTACEKQGRAEICSKAIHMNWLLLAASTWGHHRMPTKMWHVLAHRCCCTALPLASGAGYMVVLLCQREPCLA